ncbi:hypothetical protein [Corynebacterium pyruviciproducens]
MTSPYAEIKENYHQQVTASLATFDQAVQRASRELQAASERRRANSKRVAGRQPARPAATSPRRRGPVRSVLT